MSKRLAGRSGYPADEPFKVTKHDDKVFIQPMRWRKTARIFCGSMTDLFHDDFNEKWLDAMFSVMGLTYDVATTDENNTISSYKQRHIYLILSKRAERMRDYIQQLVDSDWETLRKRFHRIAKSICNVYEKADYLYHVNASMTVATWIKDGMPGLWLGVTAENQEQADKRISVLLQIPEEKRFVSIEPMLGAIDLSFPAQFEHEDNEGYGVEAIKGLDWVICGGESGPGARPVHPDWVRRLRDQCQTANVPFLFKQWGEWSPYMDDDKFTHGDTETTKNMQHYINLDGSIGSCWISDGDGICQNWTGDIKENSRIINRIGKKEAGRLLDGQLWDQYPGGGS
jgi:protein gp37